MANDHPGQVLPRNFGQAKEAGILSGWWGMGDFRSEVLNEAAQLKIPGDLQDVTVSVPSTSVSA